MIICKAETIVIACQIVRKYLKFAVKEISPATLKPTFTEQDICTRNRVVHIALGEGTVVNFTPTTLTVNFYANN